MKTFLKKAALIIASALFLAMMVTASYFVVTSLMKAFAPDENKPVATQTSPVEKPEASTPTDATPTEATPANAIPDEEEPSDLEQDTSSDDTSEIITQEIMYTQKEITVYEKPDRESKALGTVPAGKCVCNGDI